jgi:hypothetical protein
MKGERLCCQLHCVTTEEDIPLQRDQRLSGFYMQTFEMTGVEGASGETNPSAINRIYDRQSGLWHRATDEAAP